MNEKKKRLSPGQATVLYIVVAFSFFVYLIVSPLVLDFIGKICEYARNIHPILGFFSCMFFVTMYILWGVDHVIVADVLRYEYGAFETEGDP